MKKISVYLLCLFIFQMAHSEEAPKKSNKKVSIDFEEDLVEGTAQKPDLMFLFQKKNFNYKKLIRLRENFLPEMRKTSEELHRVRRKN